MQERRYIEWKKRKDMEDHLCPFGPGVDRYCSHGCLAFFEDRQGDCLCLRLYPLLSYEQTVPVDEWVDHG